MHNKRRIKSYHPSSGRDHISIDVEAVDQRQDMMNPCKIGKIELIECLDQCTVTMSSAMSKALTVKGDELLFTQHNERSVQQFG